MRSAWGMARASNSPFSLTPCHWLSLSSETTFDIAWIRPIKQFAGDIDVGAMAQRTRHDRLNHRKDVLDAVIEFIDHRGQAPFEADPDLDFAAEPQVIVGDISEQSADDAGQRKPDRGHDRGGLLRALDRVGFRHNSRATSRGRQTSRFA